MKQIIIMRTDLNMRKGKMVAQGAHASLGAVLPYLKPYEGPMGLYSVHLRFKQRVEEWLGGPSAKICVGATLGELQAAYIAAKESGMITHVVVDNGKTEFHGVPTITCCAIGPATDEQLHPITGGLKLL